MIQIFRDFATALLIFMMGYVISVIQSTDVTVSRCDTPTDVTSNCDDDPRCVDDLLQMYEDD